MVWLCCVTSCRYARSQSGCRECGAPNTSFKRTSLTGRRLTHTLGAREFASNEGFAVSASVHAVAPSKARIVSVPASVLCSRWFGLAHGVLGKLLSRPARRRVQFCQSLMLGRISGVALRKALFGWVVLHNVVPVCSVAVRLSRVRSAQHFVQADVPDGPPLNSHVGPLNPGGSV